MCEITIPLPRCRECSETERAELMEKLRLTPAHPVITSRLEQLNDDELLTDEAMDALEVHRREVSAAGGNFHEVNAEQTDRLKKLQVRSSLASHARMFRTDMSLTGYPMETLLAWAAHPSPAHRARLASHPSLPVEVLDVLARDYDRTVLAKVMENPNHGYASTFRVQANPHAAGGLAEVLGLLAAMVPPAEGDEAEVDAALDGLSDVERVRLLAFHRSED